MAHILIADEGVDAANALARYLEQHGHTVRTVGDGRGALLAVLTKAPDIIILDLLIPDIDGPSFLEVIRSYLRLYSLPVIVLTSVTSGPLLDRVKSGRVAAILPKATATHADVKIAIDRAMSQPTK